MEHIPFNTSKNKSIIVNFINQSSLIDPPLTLLSSNSMFRSSSSLLSSYFASSTP